MEESCEFDYGCGREDFGWKWGGEEMVEMHESADVGEADEEWIFVGRCRDEFLMGGEGVPVCFWG